MAAEQTFDVPDLDLPPPRARSSEQAPKEQSTYEDTSIEIEDFDSPECTSDAPEPMPRVTHVDQAIFDAAAMTASAAPMPAVSGTTRCGRCTLPIAFHARICPHCNALVMPVAPYTAPTPMQQTFSSEPVTLWSRISDVLTTIPYGFWKRSAGYTFLVMLLGNACTCRRMSIGMNLVCALIIAISFIGIGACVNQRNP